MLKQGISSNIKKVHIHRILVRETRETPMIYNIYSTSPTVKQIESLMWFGLALFSNFDRNLPFGQFLFPCYSFFVRHRQFTVHFWSCLRFFRSLAGQLSVCWVYKSCLLPCVSLRKSQIRDFVRKWSSHWFAQSSRGFNPEEDIAKVRRPKTINELKI